MWRVLVVNGPNLNLLGEREPAIYGSESLRDLMRMLREKASELDCELAFYQSNHEGDLIDFLHDHRVEADGILINPGGLTHSSVALRDALSAIRLPAIEVHLSDISNREDFRHRSLTAPACIDQVMGLGVKGYTVALEKLVDYLRQRKSTPE